MVLHAIKRDYDRLSLRIPKRTPSSDSDMSDEEKSSGKRKRESKSPKGNKRTKRGKPQKSKSTKSKRTLEGETSAEKTVKRRTVGVSGRDRTSVGEGDDMWGQRLPFLALEKILFFAVCQTGVVPLLCRASRVCRLWREAAKVSSLWHHVALGNRRIKATKATDATLEWLTANRIPPELKTINLNSWNKLTDRSFVALLESCPDIQNISIQKCAKLTYRSMDAIKDHCPNLKQLDLSFTGPSCHRLRLLDLSRFYMTTDWLDLPLEAMMKGCPLLEILRLSGARVGAAIVSDKAKNESRGFSKLLELSVAVPEKVVPVNHGIRSDFFQRVLKNSPHLKLLDMRGCLRVAQLSLLQDLTVDNLEQLYISHCPVSDFGGVDEVVSKWQHSLVELDVSWNTYLGSSLDEAMRILSAGHRLRTLDLSGTNVSVSSVKSILKGCSALECLKLSSCSSLPRGYQRCYEGKSLGELLINLQNVNGLDEDD